MKGNLYFLKFFTKIFFLILDSNPIYRIFSGKISVVALTPLLDIGKNPYIRGDTRGGGGLPGNIPLTIRGLWYVDNLLVNNTKKHLVVWYD
jgi:hypothetical protein